MNSRMVLETKEMEVSSIFSAVAAALALIAALLSMLWFNRILSLSGAPLRRRLGSVTGAGLSLAIAFRWLTFNASHPRAPDRACADRAGGCAAVPGVLRHMGAFCLRRRTATRARTPPLAGVQDPAVGASRIGAVQFFTRSPRLLRRLRSAAWRRVSHPPLGARLFSALRLARHFGFRPLQ